MLPCRHLVFYFYHHFSNVESLELLIFPLAVRHSIPGLATLLLEHWLCGGKNKNGTKITSLTYPILLSLQIILLFLLHY